ncbi:DUF2924 domain-containing protein [Crateriforma conspicua]|uniref:DUF2924 domain-containing protein n=1 Tax=Crateriforma conspicua TaxID=2527996 RepID=A0A5C6FN21_9PLAN|nr:DUF2924 domain-containing protein [Crateriforma conspicua]TWU64552.1 hypothetical protein V7x_00960 [Crateriforma conspicua]
MELNVAKEVARLQKMTCGELRDQFATVTGESTNAKNRKWLIRRIVWRMQANLEGGLSADAINRIRELADGADLRVTSPAARRLSNDDAKRTQVLPTGVQSSTTPLPGTLITRVYKGREIRVRVTIDGFEFEGELFRSLSAVAKHITGSHWSGNRFFKLDQQESK